MRSLGCFKNRLFRTNISKTNHQFDKEKYMSAMVLTAL
jgi:hypothetical protein